MSLGNRSLVWCTQTCSNDTSAAAGSTQAFVLFVNTPQLSCNQPMLAVGTREYQAARLPQLGCQNVWQALETPCVVQFMPWLLHQPKVACAGTHQRVATQLVQHCLQRVRCAHRAPNHYSVSGFG